MSNLSNLKDINLPFNTQPFRNFVIRRPLLTAFAAVSLVSTPWLYNNYLHFLEIGPGALPYNVFGWLIALALRPFARNTKTVDGYVRKGEDEKGFLEGGFKERRGGRPKMSWHVAPVRQLDRLASKDMNEKLDALFDQIVTLNPSLIQYATSPHERLHNGIVLHPSLPAPHPVASHALREVAHIHPSDHSMHVVLAPKDCKIVIEKSWGERHPLSGSPVFKILPKEYVGIYAPRDDEELEVVKKILVASLKYMTGREDVVVPS
ncbi:hypothetical protein C8Q75DRAFT_736212 [Abortiporus biennis]|nr:hypothetical protein C8Q75DRAFT_736212 [Abortiporus biennis]